jgi:hypothetical protein
MSMTPRGWSISGLAVELGRDRRTIAAAVANLQPCGRNARSTLYRIADVVEVLTAQAVTDPGSFDDARTRKMAADAVLAEIEVAKARGDVVSLDVVSRIAADDYAALRAKLLGLPDKMAPLCHTEPTVEGKRELLRRCVVEALEELSADEPGDPGFDDDPGEPGGGRAPSGAGRIPAASAGSQSQRLG